MNLTMQSSVFSGELLDKVIDKVTTEIIETMETVFGPKGTDVFISSVRDGKLYFTRDGKEVFSSIHFDHKLAEQIKDVIGQAVHNQADTIGDGTTSVSLIIPHLIRRIRKYLADNPEVNVFDFKRVAREVTSFIRSDIQIGVKEISYKDEDYRSLIYTTTGDNEYYNKIEKNIKELNGDTLIDVVLNESSSEIIYDLSTEPKIATAVQYSTVPLKRDQDGFVKLNNTAVLFVDGALSIANWRTLALLSLLKGMADIDNLVILCASMEKEVGDAIREFKTNFLPRVDASTRSNLTNLVVLKLTRYMGYAKNVIADLNTLVYDTDRAIGIGQPLDFEPKLYKVCRDILAASPYAEQLNEELYVEAFEDYNGDEEVYHYVSEALQSRNSIEVSDRETRLHKKATPTVEKRVKEIKKELATTTSLVAKNDLINRLNRFESNRLTVRIGAEIVANAQKETELMLDALKASKIALESGIIYGGGLNAIFRASTKASSTKLSGSQIEFATMIRDTMKSLLLNIYPSENYFGYMYFRGQYTNTGELKVVEPVQSAIKLVDAIELALDIACSKIFSTNQFIQNYI